MTVGKLFVYVALSIAASGIMFAAQFVLHKKATWWLCLIGFVVKLCLSALFAALAIAITSPLGRNFSFISVSLYVAFFCDALADVIGLIVVLCRKKPMAFWLRGVIGLVLTVAFLTFGLLDMQFVGSFRVGDRDLYVSQGIAGWHDPVRTERLSVYEVIKLRPAE